MRLVYSRAIPSLGQTEEDTCQNLLSTLQKCKIENAIYQYKDKCLLLLFCALANAGLLVRDVIAVGGARLRSQSSIGPTPDILCTAICMRPPCLDVPLVVVRTNHAHAPPLSRDYAHACLLSTKNITTVFG